jgi:hypothetical protein
MSFTGALIVVTLPLIFVLAVEYFALTETELAK